MNAFLETIKMSNADTKVIEINEDQEVQSILSRITAAKKINSVQFSNPQMSTNLDKIKKLQHVYV